MAEKTEDLIAVTMSASAADALAKACQWAAWRASDSVELLDDPETYTPAQQRAAEAYKWLTWGASWMNNAEARIEIPDVTAVESESA